MRYHELAGNLHIHTVYSDGSGLHREVAAAAAAAGLDFVVTTDHNVWVQGVEGYVDGVLLLVGEEVHDVRRTPQANHLLAYGTEGELSTTATDPQALIDQVNRRGGFCFLAHPFERGSPISDNLAAIPWESWEVSGYCGLEIWNAMSEFKGLLWNRPIALLYSYAPLLGLRGPFPATLRRWDELLQNGHRLAAIGGADAHANTYRMGLLRRVVFPYATLFRWVNTHVLVERSLTGDVKTDKSLLYSALRAGRTWVGYDRLASTRGFSFHARSGANTATVGEELLRAAAINFQVDTPQRGEIRLLRDGRLFARARGTSLRVTTAEPGIYRVEVYRTFRGARRAWILSSPIYVR